MSSLSAITTSSAASPPCAPKVEPSTPRIVAFGLSHRGLVRQANEDSFTVAAQLGLCAVPDGMGGAAAGEVASRMAVDALRATFEDSSITWPSGQSARPSPAPGLPRLVAGFERANARVNAAAHADQTKAGMGTTLTALLVDERGAALAHVGDSRAYLLRRHQLARLTFDHTVVDEALRSGEMTREEAACAPNRHVITRAIGTRPEVQVDRRLVSIERGDVFLLATDGLHGVVGDDDIAALLSTEPDLTRAASRLEEAALDAGAPDNVTVVLVRIV